MKSILDGTVGYREGSEVNKNMYGIIGKVKLSRLLPACV